MNILPLARFIISFIVPSVDENKTGSSTRASPSHHGSFGATPIAWGEAGRVRHAQ